MRCSQGLDVESYVGSFYKPPNSPTDIYLPAVDCDKAIVAKLVLTEKLAAGNEGYLQSALLYTAPDGARRIRVSTLALPITDQMGDLFKGADLDAQLAVVTRQVREPAEVDHRLNYISVLVKSVTCVNQVAPATVCDRVVFWAILKSVVPSRRIG